MTSLPSAQRALMEAMSELSEQAYEAGWMMGLEYALWRMVLHGPRRYGRLHASDEQVDGLKSMSQACGGWIVFDEVSGETFVALEAWLEMYDASAESKAHLLD